MRIAIVGYGKMGRLIERIAAARGHEAVARFDGDNNPDGDGLTAENLKGVDAAVEFSTPETAAENLRRLIELRIPAVAGATGWYARLDEIKKLAADRGSPLVFSSNFSVGMNLFFRVVHEASELFARHGQYDTFLVEAHHKFKKDAPSGTALVIAKLMRESYGDRAPEAVAIRAGHIPGTHEVGFDSEADTITLTHMARSREGFAAGAVLAAEKIVDKQGVYEFSELLFS
ncbi:MAG TPA: dihydrodipicolinate reductase C-terminal domain-containing protein [Blastocatellia bacterium]|nr:dihydrodipicolinate reductase C-terminal domain-containing protein [Blastocatellia bacterium]